MARRTVTVDVEVDKEFNIRRPNLRGLPLSCSLESDDGTTMTISVEGSLSDIRELEKRTEEKAAAEGQGGLEPGSDETAAEFTSAGKHETDRFNPGATREGEPSQAGLQPGPTGGLTTHNVAPDAESRRVVGTEQPVTAPRPMGSGEPFTPPTVTPITEPNPGTRRPTNR